MAAADAEALGAADIICSLRGADLAGWTPPWCKPAPSPSPSMEGELIWPAVARGKRSRRRSPAGPSSAAPVSGKARWARASPASPLDYSGGSGSGSGASTSGGEDGGFCSLAAHRRAAATTKGRRGLHRTAAADLPDTASSARRAATTEENDRLPEVQELVRSLAVENESLRQEMRALQRACTALSKENDKLETRLERSNSHNGITSNEQKGKQQLDQQPVLQSPQGSFVLPDLNLPAHDTADVSVH
ncbi:hypothetical protein ACP70R_029734 [Stipagrostis hirtigluma subsp. patula]